MRRGNLLCVWSILAVATLSAPSYSSPPEVRITLPADGTILSIGSPVTVTVLLSPSVGGSPISLRLDGASIQMGGRPPYVFRCDTSDWAPGMHILEAVAILSEGELRSPAVTIELLQAAQSAPTRAPPHRGFTDEFGDATLDRSAWQEFDSDPGVRAEESAGELRISGTANTDGWIEDGVYTLSLANQPVDASVDFLVAHCEGPGEQIVYLQLCSTDTAQTFGVLFDIDQGYGVQIAHPFTTGESSPAFGNESWGWHNLRLTYDPETGIATGHVDDVPLGSFAVDMGCLAVGLVFATDTAGTTADIRFDNFRMSASLPTARQDLSEPISEVGGGRTAPDWVTPEVGEEAGGEWAPLVRGEIVSRRTEHGEYLEYVPTTPLCDPLRILVLVHGSPPTRHTALETARFYIRRAEWLCLAEIAGLIVVAPVFDVSHFSGYYMLAGSPVGADQFVLEIIDSYSRRVPSTDGRCYLFGHSAGAQFAHRFLVTHPDRVAAAVICSAGNYAYPDDDIAWPYGRNYSPYPEGFLQAASLPVAVFVGSLDTDESDLGGRFQHGRNRVQRSQTWVESMQRLAITNGQPSRVSLVIVPGADHSYDRLSPLCAEWLLRVASLSLPGG